MSEDTLKHLSLNDLLQLLELTINELLAMRKTSESVIAIQEKRKEIELMHKVIVARRAEAKPA